MGSLSWKDVAVRGAVVGVALGVTWCTRPGGDDGVTAKAVSAQDVASEDTLYATDFAPTCTILNAPVSCGTSSSTGGGSNVQCCRGDDANPPVGRDTH